MIGYEWHTSVPARCADELRAMLADAAAFDAEAGFSTVRGADDDGPAVAHLLVTLPPRGQRGRADLDELPDAEVVAYLRLETVDGLGRAQLVVRKEFRSLGVATLLLERLRDEQSGWASRVGLARVAGWAHGAHPAADRLASRFGARLQREVVKQMRPVHPRSSGAPADPPATTDAPACAGLEHHRAGAAPADAALLDAPGLALLRTGGGAVVVRSSGPSVLLQPMPEGEDPEELDDLLVLGLAEAQRREARAAYLYVDVSSEPLLLHLSRELGFFHDQSDREFALDLRPAR